MTSDDTQAVRHRLKERTEAHLKELLAEAQRLAGEAARLGAKRVVLFGSLVKGTAGLSSDLDLLIVIDSPLGFLERTVEIYRHLKPRVGTDMLIYTPEEMVKMPDNPMVRLACKEGQVLYEA